MLSTRNAECLGTVNDFYWEFKPVLSYSKPHTFSTVFSRRKRNKYALTLSITALV